MCHVRDHRLHKADAGFTLMELVATAVIAGVLAATAAPTMMNFVRDNQLAAQANALTADLRFARSEAIKRRQNITVCRSDDSFTDCSTNTGVWNEGWIVLDERGEVLRVNRGLENAYTLRELEEHQPIDALVYTSNGTPLSLEVRSFQLCDQRGASHGKTIQVTATGRPRMGQASLSDC